jgi:hypothetical protein
MTIRRPDEAKLTPCNKPKALAVTDFKITVDENIATVTIRVVVKVACDKPQ